ncbi:MAG: hypothetical protein ACOCRX_12500 [Candidatus Woesearchaeota archaeon]
MNKEKFVIAINGLRQSYNRLEKSIIGINNEDIHDEIYLSLSETLLWINVLSVICNPKNNEVMKKIKVPYIKIKKVLGMKHAFNLVKHCIDLVELHNIKEETFFLSSSFPASFKAATWKKLKELPEGGNNQDNKTYYEEYLQGRKIIYTIKEIKEVYEDVQKELDY